MTKAEAINGAKKWTKNNPTEGAFVYRDEDHESWPGGYTWMCETKYRWFNVPEQWVTEYIFDGEIEEVY